MCVLNQTTNGLSAISALCWGTYRIHLPNDNGRIFRSCCQFSAVVREFTEPHFVTVLREYLLGITWELPPKQRSPQTIILSEEVRVTVTTKMTQLIKLPWRSTSLQVRNECICKSKPSSLHQYVKKKPHITLVKAILGEISHLTSTSIYSFLKRQEVCYHRFSHLIKSTYINKD